jgi:hypothetical protein
MAALHGTFDINDDLKLGVFGSYERRNIDQTNISDPTYQFDGQANLSAASSDTVTGSLGVEALYQMAPRSWVQGRVGLVKRLSDGSNWVDATTGASTSAHYNVAQDYGYQLGLGARVGVTQNLSLSGDVSFYSILPAAGGYENSFAAVLTGQYDFVDTAVAAYTQFEYQKYFSSAAPSSEGYTVRTGLKWSIGSITNTVRDKLFTSSGGYGHFN